MNVHIEFYLDNYKIKTFNTDSVGSYSGQITPNILSNVMLFRQERMSEVGLEEFHERP